jgi:hypothetical protein
MMTSASTRCREGSCQLSATNSQFRSRIYRGMNWFSTVLAAFFLFAASSSRISSAQVAALPGASRAPSVSGSVSGSTISLLATSTLNVISEMGGAFKSGSKCDADGNLYIRKFALDRPLLGPVVKIDTDGKRAASFDPAAFSQLALDRADAFSPASDGGIYQIAQNQSVQGGVVKPHIYVLHFSSDGSPASATLLDADFEVYTFAAFADGNLLLSGVRRDVLNAQDRGRSFTAVFSSDGRELAQLSFQKKPDAKPDGNGSQTKTGNDPEEPAPTLDLSDAEVGSDGNLYVMRGSSPALIYVIAPSGKIMKTMKIAAPMAGAEPRELHVSGNRLALAFESGERQTLVVVDAQTGRKIAAYGDPAGLGPSFVCYSANEGIFTFLKLGEGNALEVTRAEAQ